jgi:lipopolysaccharide transport system permease protein
MSDKEYVIEANRNRIIDWKELIQYNELFYFFTWRDIKIKYKQTTLGVLWVVLQPIFTVLIFSLFFGYGLKVPSAGTPYPVFVFSGVLLWNFFSASINSAGNSMLTQAPIIKKIYFPRIIIPVSAMLVAFFDFVISFFIFLIVLVYYQVEVDFVQFVVYWPLAILLMLFSAVGVSCWLAALTVKYRDFRHVIPFGLQILLFISPVIYPTASIVKIAWINYLIALNPIYSAINLFRMPFLHQAENPVYMFISIGSCLFLLVYGVYYFKKTEIFFADIV